MNLYLIDLSLCNSIQIKVSSLFSNKNWKIRSVSGIAFKLNCFIYYIQTLKLFYLTTEINPMPHIEHYYLYKTISLKISPILFGIVKNFNSAGSTLSIN